MSGMNLVFHLVSALGAVVLVYLLLKVQRERDFARELLLALGARRAKVHVEAPRVFLGRFAETLGVPFEADEAKGGQAPCRIAPGPLVDLFLRAGIGLIRCKEAGGGKGLEVELEVPADRLAAVAGSEPRLAAALGGARVSLVASARGPEDKA